MGSARDRGLQRCAIIAAYLASWPARPSAPPGARRKNHMLSPCTMRHLVAILTTFACFGAVALSRMSSHQAKMVGTSPATAAGSCFMLIYVDTTGCSGGNGDERDCSKGYQGRRCNQCTEYNDRMCEAGSDVARAHYRVNDICTDVLATSGRLGSCSACFLSLSSRSRWRLTRSVPSPQSTLRRSLLRP